jgi:acetylornithine deacetylase
MAERAVNTLCRLIETPSFSREESAAADIVADVLEQSGRSAHRVKNNIWAKNQFFDEQKPVLLLCSHLDTVKPNAGYTRNPFAADIEDGKLYGLGSNDAGAALVCLLETFLKLAERPDLPFNIVFAAVAEEEISGKDGIACLLPFLGKIDFAIIGEPTLLQMAVAERGLLVLDGVAQGWAGHAAREEGENALYIALDDIHWIRHYRFPHVSEWLGPVKMSVTMIQSGTQHNVVPDTCHFTVDVRVNDCYTLEEIFETVQAHTRSKMQFRSMRLRATAIGTEHPLVQAGLALGSRAYGSPTLSDKALLPCPTLKIGPGDSARSHSADEFVFLAEIQNGVDFYTQLIEKTAFKLSHQQ